jgi:serine/threonine protein kinase
MGEVYRARDTRLKRDVAVKVLPSVFAGDAARVARFRREAEMLAALNHPHIAGIHHLENLGESRLIVMELVEGDTLADRIARRPIPVDETVAIAQQIARSVGSRA